MTRPIRIWTIQAQASRDRLIRNRMLVAESEICSGDPEAIAYRWITRQVNSRLGSCCLSPVWAWRNWGGGEATEPNTLAEWHMPRGQVGYLIEIEICPTSIVLSQFEMWTWVLSGKPVPKGFSDFDNTAGMPADRVSKEQFFCSWERIFDLSFGDEDFWGPKASRWVQVCLPELAYTSVVSETRFVAN